MNTFTSSQEHSKNYNQIYSSISDNNTRLLQKQFANCFDFFGKIMQSKAHDINMSQIPYADASFDATMNTISNVQEYYNKVAYSVKDYFAATVAANCPNTEVNCKNTDKSKE